MVIATIFRCVPLLLATLPPLLGSVHWSLWLVMGVTIGFVFSVYGKEIPGLLQKTLRAIVPRFKSKKKRAKPVVPNLADAFVDSSGECSVGYFSEASSAREATKSDDLPRTSMSDSVPGKDKLTPAAGFVAEKETDRPADQDSIVRKILSEGRAAMLLRPAIAMTLSDSAFEMVRSELLRSTALVPEGEVLLDPFADWPEYDIAPAARYSARTVKVDPVFIDRYPVTNAQYHMFVESGAYRQATLWDSAVLPAVINFVDSTGRLGPRFWRDGCYLPGEENRPVVGISWYEASAYARWIGKRLPSDPEWVKAACWPIADESGGTNQRRYPWGDVLQAENANLWGSGPGHVVDVGQYPEGDSVAGVHDMVGNVWEWTSGAFRGGYQGPAILADGSLRSGADGSRKHRADIKPGERPSETAATLENMSIKTIRGGAYDTYFINQATCQFESGAPPLSRRHNVGFRTVIGVADLILQRSADMIPTSTAASQSKPESTPVTSLSDRSEPMPVGAETGDEGGSPLFDT